MTTRAPARIGLALAGGAPEGAIYEIGALRALEESIAGLDLNALDVYVGVSAGACIAANLANQIAIRDMCAALAGDGRDLDDEDHPFVPETFLQPAIGEFFRRGTRVPGLLAEAWREWARGPGNVGLAEALARLSRALPVAAFDGKPVRDYLRRLYRRPGRSDDFRQLTRRLVVVATELESGCAMRFGDFGHDHVPISTAVQASMALPGLYPPVEIENRHYVDGILLKTLHASVALEDGAKLVLCVNPIVPVDLQCGNGNVAESRSGQLVDRGLAAVLSQTFRTLIHSRLQVGLAAYRERYPDADVLLFEPRRDDHRMFFTNIFTFSSRRAVCEHAYLATRRDLRERAESLGPVLARHGMHLRHEVLMDEGRTVWDGLAERRELRAGHEAKRVDLPTDTLSRLAATLDRLEGVLDT
ncbi:MAG TPA: patatin-like phospholipase family protein [Thermoanaerobaculia bacterium]|jgi:predicted acylesterase/phospholipase RssA|nr:patatin-like phospholipase family protein [Thermoanaerobaculia bacterium]